MENVELIEIKKIFIAALIEWYVPPDFELLLHFGRALRERSVDQAQPQEGGECAVKHLQAGFGAETPG